MRVSPRTVWVAFCALLLASCLDVEERVRLEPGGTGSITVSVVTTPMFAEAFKDKLLIPGAVARNVIRGERFFHEEEVAFGTLAELQLEQETITVRPTTSATGLRQATLEHVIRQSGIDPLSAALLMGHSIRYTAELPGAVIRAVPVRVRGIEIEPVVAANRATWQLPLHLIAQAPELRLQVDFSSWSGGTVATRSKASGASLPTTARSPEPSAPPAPDLGERLATGIREQLRLAVQRPPFHGDETSLYLLRIAELLGAPSYQDLYLAAIGRRNLAVGYLRAADQFLKEGDIPHARSYLGEGARRLISSNDLLKAAENVYAGGIETGFGVAYNASKALALSVGAIVCSYPCYEALDYAFLVTDFAVDVELRSWDEAARRLVVDGTLAVLASRSSKALASGVTHVVGQPGSVHAILDDFISDPQSRAELMQAIGRTSMFATKTAIGMTQDEVVELILRRMRSFNETLRSSGSRMLAASEPVLAPRRAVDFANMTYESPFCARRYGDYGIGRTMRVQNGDAVVAGVARGQGYFGIARRGSSPDGVLYGDLTGDGTAEAVVHLACGVEQANYGDEELQVFRLGDHEPAVIARIDIDRIGSDYASYFPGGSVWRITDAGARVDDTRIQFEAFADGPHCCPEWIASIAYYWDGRAMVMAGPPRRRPFRADAAPSASDTACIGSSKAAGFDVERAGRRYRVMRASESPLSAPFFVDEDGNVVRDPALLHDLAAAAWTVESVLRLPGIQQRRQLVTNVYESLVESKSYELVQEVLVRGSVEAMEALATGGVSLTTAIPDLTVGIVRSQLANLKTYLGAVARARLLASKASFETLELLMASLKGPTFETEKLREVARVYRVARTLELPNMALAAGLQASSSDQLLAQVGRTLVSQAASLPGVLPPQDGPVTFQTLLKLESATASLLSSEPAMRAWANNLALVQRLAETEDRTVDRWAEQAARACDARPSSEARCPELMDFSLPYAEERARSYRGASTCAQTAGARGSP